MHIEYHKWFSQNLNKDMELKVYGHWGLPLLIFPCAGGKFYEFEDFGMTKAIEHLINGGKVKVFTVDSVDHETWLNYNAHPADRAKRHNDYDRYIIREVVPFIFTHVKSVQPIITGGCSLGGMHALNFLLKHPDVFRMSISLSGVYSLRHFVGNYIDDNVYYNSPIDYLPGLTDDWFLSRLKTASIILCCGQGAWEEECLADTRTLEEIFRKKGIPARVEIWGHDVCHDWPWWRRQMPYFLEQLLNR